MNETKESRTPPCMDECQESRTHSDMNKIEESMKSLRMNEFQETLSHLDINQTDETTSSSEMDKCHESLTHSDTSKGSESLTEPPGSEDDDGDGDQATGWNYKPLLYGLATLFGVSLGVWGMSKVLKKTKHQPTESDAEKGHRECIPPLHEKQLLWGTTERRMGTSRRLSIENIGINFNQWRQPVATFGPAEGNMQRQLCWKLGLDNFDINSTEWKKATDVADRVINMLLHEVSQKASDYKLKIEKGVRQGSAREGLKVCAADEFDVLLQFSIEGLKFEVQPDVDRYGRILPEIGKLRVVYPTTGLTNSFPKLSLANVFDYQKGHVYLNSKNLHEKVFTAIIDKAINAVQGKLDSSADCDFQITRAINQPAVKITIKVKKNSKDLNISDHVAMVYEACRPHMGYRVQLHSGGLNDLDLVLDIDLVPALLICYDKVPDPTDHRATMLCPRYAVFKWVREHHPFPLTYGVNPETIWRMDSSGYEKHVMDVAQGTPEQRYILTAQRVLKAYFIYENKKRERNNLSPSQLVTVLRSYFLKQIAFYCILYYTVLNKYPLSGVKEALTILLDFLHICLEEKRLPHFFHSNPGLRKMFPEYDIERNAIRYDVFHNISQEALLQADYGLRRDVRPTLDDFTCELNAEAKHIQDEFREYVVRGTYL